MPKSNGASYSKAAASGCRDGARFTVGKGDFWRTPGGVSHGFIAGPKGARILDIFSPPRSEYKKSGAGFGADADT